MITRILIMLILVGCGSPSAPGGGSGAVDAPAGSHDGASNGDGSGSSNSDGSSPYVCTPIAGDGCCVLSPNTCSGNTVCQYSYGLDNSTHTAPSQGAGTCHATGTLLPLGALCEVGVVACPGCTQPTCGYGAWCAYDANTSPSTTPANQGHCRQLCDPNNLTAHGCPSGKTCGGMPYCVNLGSWPNCPPTAGTLGFCS